MCINIGKIIKSAIYLQEEWFSKLKKNLYNLNLFDNVYTKKINPGDHHSTKGCRSCVCYYKRQWYCSKAYFAKVMNKV